MSEQSGKTNGQSLTIDRAELRRRLSRLAPRARLDALVEAENARELVQSIPGEDLYLDIVEVGLADAADVVQLASPSQFRTFVDLGAWTRDRAEVHRLITWLRAARGGENEDYLAKVHALDLEMLEVLLRHAIVLHDREENPDVDPQGVTLETPEGKYLIEFTVQGAELSALRSLVSDLIAEDPFQAIRFFDAVRWEATVELEEVAYRFRTARLADLGFPPLDEAMSLFAFVDPAKIARAAPSDVPGSVVALQGADFLDTASSDMGLAERDALEEQLRYVANSALVAEAAEPGDPEDVKRVARMSRDYLSLGIEYLASGDPSKAAAVLRDHHPRRIFQIGFSLTLRLKFKADRIAKEPWARIEEAYLMFPHEAAVVAALRQKRPLRALIVEGAEAVTFRSLRELREAEQVLVRAAEQVAILKRLLAGSPEEIQAASHRFGAPFAEIGIDRLFNAVVANAVLDGKLQVSPVSRGKISLFCELSFEGDPAALRVRQGAFDRVGATLAPLVDSSHRDELNRLIHGALEHLLGELGAAWRAGRPIPREALVNLPHVDGPL